MIKWFRLFFITLCFSNQIVSQITLSSWNTTTSTPNVVAAAAGSNRLLVYIITMEDDDNTNDVTSVSYGGQALTQAVESTTFDTGTGGSQSRVEFWYLNEAGITASTNTTFTPVFSISNPTAAPGSHGYYTGVVTLTGVNQTTPICTTGIGRALNQTTLSLSSAISMLSSELMIYATHGGNALTHTPSGGFTEDADMSGAGGGQSSEICHRTFASATSINPTCTASGNQNRFVMAAVRIIPSGASCAFALPIELSTFKAQTLNEGVLLEWETASEHNNHYFELEKTVNGNDWEIISKADGAGTKSTPTKYSAMDLNVIENINYYRLKQVDFDKSFTYSRIITTERKLLNTEQVKVFPNPCHNEIYITNHDSFYPLKLYNYLETDFSNMVKFTFIDTKRTKVDVSQLPQGIYIIRSLDTCWRFVKL